MNFKSIFLPLMFLPDFQSSRSNAFFKSIVQVATFGPVLAEEAKETQQCFGRSVWSDPKQSLATFIDLVNQRRRTCNS